MGARGSSVSLILISNGSTVYILFKFNFNSIELKLLFVLELLTLKILLLLLLFTDVLGSISGLNISNIISLEYYNMIECITNLKPLLILRLDCNCAIILVKYSFLLSASLSLVINSSYLFDS